MRKHLPPTPRDSRADTARWNVVETGCIKLDSNFKGGTINWGRSESNRATTVQQQFNNAFTLVNLGLSKQTKVVSI